MDCNKGQPKKNATNAEENALGIEVDAVPSNG
jgi:hypothetical protein